MFNHVTVGIDGSGPSLDALRWALDNVVTAHTDLVLKHVVVRDRAEGERALNKAVELSSRAGVPGRPVIAVGDPTAMLTRDLHPGELLVIGSHKTGYLHGRVTGTRSVHIPALAPCATAVVPHDTLTQRRGVIVGVSSEAGSRAAVTAAAFLARRHGETLSLLCATSTPETGRQLLAAAADLAELIAPGIPILQRVSPRRPADALLDASRSARVLVIGASQSDSDRPGVPGSVMHEVLLNLNSPVMLAR